MTNYNIKNEILKKQYEQYLELDERLSAKTVHVRIKDLRKYEEVTNFKDFTTFNANQALDFKDMYKKAQNSKGKYVRYATIFRTLTNLKEFFLWLAKQNGYKRKIKVTDIRAFNLTKKEKNIAKTKGFKNVPTLEQIYKTIYAMPTRTEKDKRNQAMVAFTILTGVRVTALMSLQLQHVDEYKHHVKQDPNVVKTKFGKTILTQFFPVDKDVQQIVLNWIKYLKEEKMFGREAPLFPSMASEWDKDTQTFLRDNLSTSHMQSTTTVRDIFKEAFQNAGIEYFNPHVFRDTLVQLGERICTTPEDFKAWSQNIGHSSPLTTFTSYGDVYPTRQCDIIRKLAEK